MASATFCSTYSLGTNSDSTTIQGELRDTLESRRCRFLVIHIIFSHVTEKDNNKKRETAREKCYFTLCIQEIKAWSGQVSFPNSWH